MGLRATWPIASNTGAKSDPLSSRDKSKIWHQGDLPAKDDPEKKGIQNSIETKCALYWTENEHANDIYLPLLPVLLCLDIINNDICIAQMHLYLYII